MTKVQDSVRRKIVELLFEAELDEDFQLGIEEGQDRAQLSMLRNLDLLMANTTKKNQPGIQAAIDQIKANLV